MTSLHIEKTLFKCTRHKIYLIILTLISLHCMIYTFSKFLVGNYFSDNVKYSVYFNSLQEATRRNNVSGYITYFTEDVPTYKLNVNDYGDTLKRNYSSIYENLDIEVIKYIERIKTKEHFTVENATVKDVMFLDPIDYLQDYKNPCFTQKLESVYHLKCLPYFFVAGFTKCGTTDFHGRLTQHPFVTSGWTKEPHWWDDIYHRGLVLQEYSDYFQQATKAIASYQGVNYLERRITHPAIIGDFTPRTVWHGSDWRSDVLNVNQTEPKVLLPHKIKHLIPIAKIIVLIRNPTERLYSDYIDIMIRYNSKTQPPTPQHFHNLVTKAIQWWDNCILKHSERICAYGYPPGVPPLDEQVGLHWTNKSADRLRIGLYAIYLKEWIQVFGRSNVQIVILEEYKKDPISYLKNCILPFLSLPPLNSVQKSVIEKILPLNTRYVRLDPKHDLPMLNSTRTVLDRFYDIYNKRLLLYLDHKPDWIP